MSTTSAPVLSEREMKLLVAALQSCETCPKPDMSKLADTAGYKTSASATTAWINLRKKLGLSGPAEASPKKRAAADLEDGAVAESPKKAKATVKDDANIKSEVDEGGADHQVAAAAPEIPKKRGRGRPPKAKPAVAADDVTPSTTNENETEHQTNKNKDDRKSAAVKNEAADEADGDDEILVSSKSTN